MAAKNSGVEFGIKIYGDIADIKTKLSEQSKQLESFKKKSEQQLGGIGSNFDKMNLSMESIGKKITTQIKTLGAYAVSLVAIGGAAEIAKKGISSTQFSADAFDKVMSQGKFATDQFFIAVTSGDMSHLIKQLSDAADAGGRYAETLDWLGDAQLAVTLRSKESDIELKALEAIFRDNSGETTWEKRTEALETYKTKAKQALNDQLKLDKTAYENELKNNALVKTGLTEQDFIFVLKNYDIVSPELVKAQEHIQKYNDLLNASTTISQGQYSYTVKDANAKEKAAAYYSKLTVEEQKWFDIQQKYGRANDEVLKKVADAWGKQFDTQKAIEEVNVQTIRVQSSILKQKEKELKVIADARAEAEKLKRVYDDMRKSNDEWLSSTPSLTSKSSEGVPGSTASPLSFTDNEDTISTDLDLYLGKVKELTAEGYSLNDALMKASKGFSSDTIIQGLSKVSQSLNLVASAAITVGDQLGSMAAEGKISVRSLLQTVIKAATATILANMLATDSEYVKKVMKTAKNPYLALALAAGGIALISGLFMGLVGKMPAAAEGYIASGNSIVNVGEYPNASNNPEIGAPLSKWRKILGIENGLNNGGGIAEMKIHLNTVEAWNVKTQKYFKKK